MNNPKCFPTMIRLGRVLMFAIVALPFYAQALTLDGEGTEASPYLIGSYEQLKLVGTAGYSVASVYRLTADIDASNSRFENKGAGFIPIADMTVMFTGKFHGAGHVISNLYINRPTEWAIGLFAGIGAVGRIDSLGLENVDLVASQGVGAIAGYSEGVLSQCYSTGFIAAKDQVNIIGGSAAGGLIGFSGAVTDTTFNSFSLAKVTGADYVGGLNGRSAAIMNSYSAGPVVATTALVGGLTYEPLATITGSYWNFETSGQLTSGGGAGLSAASMVLQASFDGWNFANTWFMGIEGPELAVFKNTQTIIFHLQSNIHQYDTLILKAISTTGLTISFVSSDTNIVKIHGDTLIATGSGLVSIDAKDANGNIAHRVLRVANTLLGKGTNEDPYSIASYEDLKVIGTDYRYSLSSVYRLGNNIDASLSASENGDSGFISIGTSFTPFSGKFHGAGHVIRNLTIASSGLFYSISASGIVDSLGIQNANVLNGSPSGILAGSVSGLISESYGTGIVNGTGSSGGLVGSVPAGGRIRQSYAYAQVLGGTASGGLVGTLSGIIDSSFAASSLQGTTVGGLIAVNSSGTVNASFWNSDVSNQATSALGAALTSTQFLDQSNFVGWDFAKTWKLAKTGPLLTIFGNNQPVVFNALPQALAGENSTLDVISNISSFVILQSSDTNKATVSVSTVTWKSSGFAVFKAIDSLGNCDSRQVQIHIQLTGSGTDALPYLIHNYDELGGVGTDYPLSAVYQLTADIDASPSKLENAGAGFIPIGTESKSFTGKFHGHGHLIKGLYINRPTTPNVGLIGFTSATAVIDSLGLTGGSITGSHDVGGLVGQNMGLIEFAYSTNDVRTMVSYDAGGLVGWNKSGGILRNSYSSGKVVLTTSWGGGLSGDNEGSIINSYSTGQVVCLNASSTTCGGMTGGSGTATSSYWNTESSLKLTSVKGTALNNTTARAVTSFSAWNFTTIWNNLEGSSYPFLRGMDNAPMARIDTLKTSRVFDVSRLLANDVDPETGTGNLIARIDSISIGKTDSTKFINFPVTAVVGDTIKVRYRVGEVRAAQKDTLWGGAVTSRIILANFSFDLASDSVHTYGDADFSVSAQYTGAPVPVISSDISIAEVNANIVSIKKAGTVTLTALSPDAGEITQTLRIQKKTITIVHSVAQNKAYDANTVATITGATLDGVVGADVVDLTIGTATFDTKDTGTAKVVTVTGSAISGSASSNYALTEVTGLNANITAKTITIASAVAQNKVYDATTAATITGAKLDGVIGSEVVDLTLGAATFDTKDTGTAKVVTVTGSTISGSASSNYKLTEVTGLTANITAKALTIANAVAQNKVYDATTAANVNGATVDGLIGAETVDFTLGTATFDTKDTGTAKVVTVTGSAISGSASSNYALTEVTGLNANITAKTITIASAVAQNKVYDATTVATITGAKLDGVIGFEVVDLTLGTATFDTKDTGTAKVVTVTGSAISGSASSNYKLTEVTGLTANITAKALTIANAVAQNKVYDATTAATVNGARVDGLVDAETVDFTLGSASFDTKDTGTAKVVTVTGSAISGSASSNYKLTEVTGLTANITAKALTIANAVAQNKVYDATTAATVNGATVDGLVGAETVDFTLGLASFDTKDTGTAKVVTVTGSAISGTASSNYKLTEVNGLTANITPKTLTIASAVAQNKVYDATTAATVNGATVDGLVGAETVDFTLGTATFDTKDTGTAKVVTVTGSAISGSASSNYKLTEVSGLTANITPKTIYVVANADTITAGEADSLTLTVTGLLNGDTLTGILARDTGSAAGVYNILQGTLAAGSNYLIDYTGAKLVINAVVNNRIVTPQVAFTGTAQAVIMDLKGHQVWNGLLSVQNGQFQMPTIGSGAWIVKMRIGTQLHVERRVVR